MPAPRLTFFCELDTPALQELFTQALIADLLEMRAAVSLGILDHSPERAEVVRRLNQAGVPVTGWLLLPKEQGYWFNLRNAEHAALSYRAFREWTAQHGLAWQAVGLDFEPDIRELENLTAGKLRLLPLLIKRALGRKEWRAGRSAYVDLVAQIHADGYLVESYQFFLIADDRLARSTLVQRVTGIVDVPVDREILMLYTSFWRSPGRGRGGLLGPGILWSYGPQAQAIGLGSTGGGVETLVGDPRPLTWDEFARDLRMGWYMNENLYVFSLEGCARQEFFPRLKNFAWDMPILTPEASLDRVNEWRAAFHGMLWVSTHLRWIFGFTAALILFLWGLRRYLRGR